MSESKEDYVKRMMMDEHMIARFPSEKVRRNVACYYYASAGTGSSTYIPGDKKREKPLD